MAHGSRFQNTVPTSASPHQMGSSGNANLQALSKCTESESLSQCALYVLTSSAGDSDTAKVWEPLVYSPGTQNFVGIRAPVLVYKLLPGLFNKHLKRREKSLQPEYFENTTGESNLY